ncbi:hypothetical protein FOPG_19562 [Fusarium oxysporum f. sp. conglutinans race 2 54008]|uniref:Uncharacterized protein n=1 Tax=Fusarium oxysporum f. sp. conglutinans race 2 54008 TaxID=1089457 RepID=X0GLI7_FUSOX|nr:hypothetical protein FOPG_19562 [Fusarium oxysporum f. sp. conglutinans race 2 54008]
MSTCKAGTAMLYMLPHITATERLCNYCWTMERMSTRRAAFSAMLYRLPHLTAT